MIALAILALGIHFSPLSLSLTHRIQRNPFRTESSVLSKSSGAKQLALASHFRVSNQKDSITSTATATSVSAIANADTSPSSTDSRVACQRMSVRRISADDYRTI
jgi:hypothetical protein